jgi:CysZ protein
MIWSDIQLAAQSYLKAFHLMNKHKLWGLVIMSGLVYLFVISLGIYGVWSGMSTLSDWIFDFGIVKKLDGYKALHFLFKILTAGIFIISFFVYFSLFKFVLLTIASPLYAYISEKTASILTGKEYEFNLQQFLIDIARGIKMSLKNLLKQTFLTIIILLLGFIPIVGLLSAIILIFIDSYYYGFSMLDYNCERNKWSVAQSAQYISNRKGLAIGNGLVFYGLFLIPVVGIVFGAPLSAMAAVISMKEEL